MQKMKKQKTFQNKYPRARRDKTITENYFKSKIRDPYRWLENPHDIETRDFVVSQNHLTQEYLGEFLWRDHIKEKIHSLLNYPKRSIPIRRGSKYYQKRNSGLENQDVLYVSDTVEGEGWIFLDANKLSFDGSVSLRNFEFSTNGVYMAYSLSISGSDWMMVKVRNTRTSEDLNESLYKVKYSKISWNKYDTGFFYSGYLTEKDVTYTGISSRLLRNHKLYFHRLNSDQDEDVIVGEFEDPKMMVVGRVTNCGNYLVVYAFTGCKNNLVYYASLAGQDEENYTGVEIQPVIKDLVASFTYVTNINSKFLFRTDKDAPNYRLVSIKVKSEESVLVDVIPEHDEHIMLWAKPINHSYLVVCYLADMVHHLQLHTLDGTKMMDLNAKPGTITDVSGEHFHDELFFSVTSQLDPNIIYRIDFSELTPEASVLHETKILDFYQENYDTKNLTCPSSDGTEIPITIFHSKTALILNGANPCLLQTYGDFGLALTPTFNPLQVIFVTNYGGICVVAHVRGGGEFGERWHLSGSGLNKQNSFDDLQFAVKFLIDNKYTNPNLITIQGLGINGGLLAAVSVNQSPELFGCAIISKGVLDMIRFDKFTIGFSWASEYGSPDVEEYFELLIKYSPIHNIKIPSTGHEYPAILTLTADHDDLVVPSHSLKYTAHLQHILGNAAVQKKPFLLKVDMKAGHGFGSSSTKCMEELVDVLTFIAKTLNLKIHNN